MTLSTAGIPVGHAQAGRNSTAGGLRALRRRSGPGGRGCRCRTPMFSLPPMVGSLAAGTLGGEGRSCRCRVRPLALGAEVLAGCWHFKHQPPEGETPTLFFTVGQSSTALDSRSLSRMVLTDPLHDVSRLNKQRGLDYLTMRDRAAFYG